MPIAIEMPKMTDTMEEGVLVEWSVEEGDKIAAGDVIAQVETDKATMDVEAYDDGVLLKKVAKAGDALPIGGLIAILGDDGEDVSQLIAEHESNAAAPTPSAETAAETPPADKKKKKATAATSNGRTKASPLAKRMATDHGLPLANLVGSGPGGRVIKRDVEAEIARTPASVPASARILAADRGIESVRISQMRKAIARRLAESKYTSPHFYLTSDVDVAALITQRTMLNDYLAKSGGPKVSFNDFVTKACANALVQHPNVNVTYAPEDGVILKYNYVDIGVAVAIEDGLVTPVIRDVQQKSVAAIAQEIQALAVRARDKKLATDEMEGSTFTTSNLGMFGIESFTAIINPPNACILAIGGIRDTPVVENGSVVPGKRMKLTLSCDHRVVDGAVGAQFMATVKELLESPLSLLL
ncbi:MAG: 2-oxo acid dehydrogenase subunit E2 [Rhodothermaceae bacterium]|nr:2-oxo acid dehydrogenase subunit E2 [Rhodothermaceae bacterium]MXZ57425.1 2-oxo acid dehydrogenase subunit E2 [Rhodothermaceae bacterium]MYB90409.1 2-oxo acid dehydrogenase subunit E2 [Rhodothermaceae bacterium]MYD68284.1 2-oxo acid dehydrogenase subunit E2 [Rhodothermaceae bacterium]MYG44274.1 2-oxo acid dehydrogenase subunit E2 [Rhodothermaceae bacterium]